jgi:hypothetical protein
MGLKIKYILENDQISLDLKKNMENQSRPVLSACNLRFSLFRNSSDLMGNL